MENKPVAEWSVEDCIKWLDEVGMTSAKESFQGMIQCNSEH